ncbi:MAG: putative rane protein [Bacilli bacterium]|nr:putative rane protein [Bacilli bacterium]
MRKAIHWATFLLGSILLAYAAFAGIMLILYPQQSALTFWNLRNTDHQLSTLAQLTAFAAVGFWVTKTAFLTLKKNGVVQPTAILRNIFPFFQKHHVLIGWIVLVTTSAHGLYYILHKSDRMNMMVTGWIAWSGLIVLAFIGVFFDQRLKEKKKTKQIRLYHIGFSIVFLIGFVLHTF